MTQCGTFKDFTAGANSSIQNVLLIDNFFLIIKITICRKKIKKEK